MTDREYEEKVARIKWERDIAIQQFRRLWRRLRGAEKTDVVKVVRCKDCKYYAQSKELGGYCKCHSVELPFNWFPCEPDDFCSYGQKKCEQEDNLDD